MRGRWFELTLAGCVGAALAVGLSPHRPAEAQGRTPALIRGGGSAGVEKEPEYSFTTVQGNPAKAQFDRNVLKVPRSYGDLVAVTVIERDPVLWYRASDGSVRNVIVTEGRSLVRLQQE